jgi:hypothetical protein
MATTHTVNQGEYLASIAKKYGFADWRTIYDHAQNSDFKRKRPDPNVIYPGDKIFIPDKEKKDEPCATAREHRFQLKRPRTLVRIVLRNHNGQPMSQMKYRLAVGEANTYSGITKEDGLIEHPKELERDFPADSTEGELTVWQNTDSSEALCRWVLKLGHLDPVGEVVEDKAIITGVQARLNNLGFHCGKVDAVYGPKTKAAITRFQQLVLNRDNPDGEPDKETLDALVKHHGC